MHGLVHILQRKRLRNLFDMKFLIMVCLMSNVMWSQNLDAHRWKERVIIISADEENSKLAEAQLDIFKAETEKCIDRNIVIYKCVANNCEYYEGRQDSKKVKIKKPEKGFKISLIGLDGGEKFNSNKVEKAAVIFNLIDTMPMRRNEIKRRKKKND